MKIKCFEELIAWQKSQELAVDIYKQFGTMKDYGFRDQICRAVVSKSNNIAEGFDRSSDADFSRFLYFALGSCSEVKSMLYLSGKLKLQKADEINPMIEKVNEISKIIRGLIKSISN
ncbi:MAG TPA: four helix bundle protein [Saprospiraceae bacterium]|nr:four helix bundle protein [Saprospiraceae bacterium]